MEFTQKNQPFICSTSANSTFEGLKLGFIFAPILMQNDLVKHFIVQANASNFILGSVLS
jgi:hypothetical protein